MTEDKFWQLIEKAKNSSKDDFKETCELLTKYLSKHSAKDIISFENILKQKIIEGANYELLATCFIVQSYVSDDTFVYFRAWLVGQGKENFYRVLSDPNNICSLVDKEDTDEIKGESILSVAVDAFEEKTGKTDDEFLDLIEYYDEPEIRELPGIKEDEYKKMFPLLYDKFWNQEKIDKTYKDN